MRGASRDSIRYTRRSILPSRSPMIRKNARLTGLTLLVAASSLLVLTPLSAQTCGPWSWVNPVPQGNTLNGVASGGGKYVAVGRAGTILVSADGASWSVREIGSDDDLYDVVYT